MNRKKPSATLLSRVQAACDKDPTIVCAKDKLQESSGYSEQYLSYLGLSSDDLKKLEHTGYAMRGYMPAIHGGGHQVRWVLVSDA